MKCYVEINHFIINFSNVTIESLRWHCITKLYLLIVNVNWKKWGIVQHKTIIIIDSNTNVITFFTVLSGESKLAAALRVGSECAIIDNDSTCSTILTYNIITGVNCTCCRMILLFCYKNSMIFYKQRTLLSDEHPLPSIKKAKQQQQQNPPKTKTKQNKQINKKKKK